MEINNFIYKKFRKSKNFIRPYCINKVWKKFNEKHLIDPYFKLTVFKILEPSNGYTSKMIAEIYNSLFDVHEIFYEERWLYKNDTFELPDEVTELVNHFEKKYITLFRSS